MHNDADFMTIGLFARVTGLTRSALRFYGDSGLLAPDHTDRVTGYRHYSPGQIADARLIRLLRDLDLPLADVRRLLAAPADRARSELSDLLDGKERALRAARDDVASAMALIVRREGAGLLLPGPLLAAAIAHVAESAGDGAVAPVLAGVLFEFEAGQLTLVATDRYRLSVRTLGCAGPDRPLTAVVPASELRSAGDWISGLPEVEVTRSAGELAFRPPGGSGRSIGVLPGEFPDYRIVLDGIAEPTTRVTVAREALLAACGADAGSRLDVEVSTHGVRLGIFSAGSASPTVLPAAVDGVPGARISFAFSNLVPALLAAVGPDVMLEFSGAELPAVIRSADHGDLLSVVMPVRAEAA